MTTTTNERTNERKRNCNQTGNTNAPTIMIAEKTADAIRGRKLTPFEPPTRIAAGTNSYNRPALADSIFYKPLPPKPSPPRMQMQPQLIHYPLHRSEGWSVEESTRLLANYSSHSIGRAGGNASIPESHASFDQVHPNYEFMLQKYGSSKMAETLIKQLSPKRWDIWWFPSAWWENIFFFLTQKWIN